MLKAWVSVKPYLRPRARRLVFLVAGESFLAGVSEAALLVLVVGAALAVANGEEVLEGSLPILGEPSVVFALYLAAALAVVMMSLHAHQARITSATSAEVLTVARVRLLQAYGAADWKLQSGEREGALQESIGTLAVQAANTFSYIVGLVSRSVSLCALIATAVVVDAVATSSVVLLGLALMLVFRPIGTLTRTRARQFVRSNSELNELVTQWSASALELRAFGVQGVALADLDVRVRKVSANLARSRFMASFGSNLFRDLAIVLLVGSVAVLANLESVSAAAIGSVALLIVRALSYAQGVNSAAQSINGAIPNVDELDQRVRRLEATSEAYGGLGIDSGRLNIELSRISYAYSPESVGLNDVSLHIAAGECVGVLGPSGGGKSTLVQVLLRLRTPSEGRILIGGTDYRDIDEEVWRRFSAVVPQEPRLFEGSVRENIAFYREFLSDDDVERAAREANIWEEISGLPEGLNTQLGPRGAGLSGGQKQRLSIARALAGKPRLLVLDEPTSALDSTSEEAVRQTLSRLTGHVTMVIVAHRVGTLEMCDRVVSLSDGSVRAVGTLDEALASVAHYPNRTAET